MSKHALWAIGPVVLILLLVSLSCNISTPVPQPSDVTPQPSTTLSTPRATPASLSSPEPGEDMAIYANPLAGFSLRYPKDWVYTENRDGAIFAISTEALEDVTYRRTPLFSVQAGSPEDIAAEYNASPTTSGLLESALQRLCELCEVGESESWTFGTTLGTGVEISWQDPKIELQLHGYLIAAVGDEIAGVAVGTSPEDGWASYEPVFQDMLASLDLFSPRTPAPVEKGQAQPGEMVHGTLPPGGTDMWRFDVANAQYISIRLDAVEPHALDTYLELYDTEGMLVAEDDDGGTGTNSTIADFYTPITGTYTIHAKSYEGQGDYLLTLQVADAPSGGGEIAYGQAVTGMLAGSAKHKWVFTGTKNAVLTIEMNALDEQLDCFLELYGPDDIFLTSDDDSGTGKNALIESYVLLQEGNYHVIAGSVSEEPGRYELTVKPTRIITTGVLTYGDTVKATLKPGTRHHWFFRGESDDVATITMVALDGEMDTYLELFAPDGVRVMTDDDGGGGSNARIAAFVLPSDGIYRIIARGYDDDDVGDYELTLTGP